VGGERARVDAQPRVLVLPGDERPDVHAGGQGARGSRDRRRGRGAGLLRRTAHEVEAHLPELAHRHEPVPCGEGARGGEVAVRPDRERAVGVPGGDRPGAPEQRGPRAAAAGVRGHDQLRRRVRGRGEVDLRVADESPRVVAREHVAHVGGRVGEPQERLLRQGCDAVEGLRRLGDPAHVGGHRLGERTGHDVEGHHAAHPTTGRGVRAGWGRPSVPAEHRTGA
jgi:hypothetical protein